MKLISLLIMLLVLFIATSKDVKDVIYNLQVVKVRLTYALDQAEKGIK